MMMNKLMWRLGALLLLVGIGGTNALAAPISVTTVGTYAPNPNALVMNDAVSNSAAGGITLANFTASVAAAFATNRGGVLDFESVTGWTPTATQFGNGAANPITATFGAGLTKSIQYWRTDVDGLGNPVGTDANNNNGTNVVSGTNYMGISGINSPVNLTFPSGLKQLGLTFVPRGAARTVTMTATLNDATTIVSSSETIAATNTPGAYFFGFDAPGGKRIVGLGITMVDGTGAPAFARFDDLGFVIPEPATLALVSVASLGLIGALRRR